MDDTLPPWRDPAVMRHLREHPRQWVAALDRGLTVAQIAVAVQHELSLDEVSPRDIRNVHRAQRFADTMHDLREFSAHIADLARKAGIVT